MGWRFGSVSVCCVLLVGVLLGFQCLGSLSTWDRRWFNMLSVLLSSLVSLFVSSLFGFLGAMIRWPLLAAREHEPFDVS
jgi:hypothetical protein